jgi:hypothetical protein
MKAKILLFCLMLVVLSCDNDNDVVVPALHPRSEIVSVETARDVAIKLAQKDFNASALKIVNDNPHIKNEEVIAEGNIPYLYVFNFDEGFAIISAEKYEHPILAFSSHGEFISKDAPDGIILWIETTKENIDKIRAGEFDTEALTKSEWNLARKQVSSSAATREAPIDPGCQESSTTTTVGPLMATTWNQGCGYNTYCPLVTSGGACGRAWTGCVATAMAQVMRYWQRPAALYNWSTMPNTFGSTEVARLMSDAGTSVGMNYGGDASGAKHENIPGALKNTFGYTSATNIDYGLSSYSTVESNISARRPVILSGYNVKKTSWLGLSVSYEEGHEWVCDGYRRYSYTYCNEDGSFGGGGSYLYFHMNWGWGGSSDGWFGFDTWAPTGTTYNFRYCRRAIVNIYP